MNELQKTKLLLGAGWQRFLHRDGYYYPLTATIDGVDIDNAKTEEELICLMKSKINALKEEASKLK